MTELYNTESPIDRKRRNNINATWDDILSRFANLQRQINILAGGQEVDELIARLEQAIRAAEIDVQNYIIQVDESVQQAINENNNALQSALQTVSETLDELNIAISNTETATADTINAKNATIQATQDAQEAINTMQSLIDNFSHRGAWSSATQYYKNNLVEVDGRTYIALKENINTPVTNKGVWALFADKGIQGAEGPRGLPGKDGKDGTGVNILGSLNNESELPTTGKPGEAYMIAGNLYVWQENTNTWKNVGPIRGPEGKSAYDLAVENGFEGTMEEWIESLKGETGPRGPEGPQGPPGQDADLTEITEQLEQIEQTVDTHSNNQQIHVTQTKQNNWNTASTNATNLINRFPETCAIVTDWNNVVKNGLYMGSNVANAPDSAWWMGEVIAHDAAHIIQKVSCVTDNREFERQSNGGVWSQWIETSPRKLFQSVSNGKAVVNQAVTDKGVYTAPDAPFATTAANIRAIPSGGRKEVQGSFSVPALAPKATSQNYVTPLVDFQPMMVETDEHGAIIFNGTERWEGTQSYSDGFHTLRAIPEQVGSQWRVTFRFYNALNYNSAARNIPYILLSQL